jgi:hypothetical protein
VCVCVTRTWANKDNNDKHHVNARTHAPDTHARTRTHTPWLNDVSEADCPGWSPFSPLFLSLSVSALFSLSPLSLCLSCLSLSLSLFPLFHSFSSSRSRLIVNIWGLYLTGCRDALTTVDTWCLKHWLIYWPSLFFAALLA